MANRIRSGVFHGVVGLGLLFATPLFAQTAAAPQAAAAAPLAADPAKTTTPAHIATAQVTVSPGAPAVLLAAARSTRKQLSIEYLGNSGGWLVIGNSTVTPSSGFSVFVGNVGAPQVPMTTSFTGALYAVYNVLNPPGSPIVVNVLELY
jgi:hypothetical protein